MKAVRYQTGHGFSFVHRKGGVVFWVLYRSLSTFIYQRTSRFVNSSISTCICPTGVFCLVIN